MKAVETLTADRLRELLHYDPPTGVFTWRVHASRRVRAGSVAGGSRVNGGGYRRISVAGVLYYAHRLAVLYMTGGWPTGEVDHRHGGRANNALSNIRPVTRTVNAQNLRKPTARNKSGHLGVSFEKRRGKFVASICAAGTRTNLGYFDSAEAAGDAYLEAKRRLHEGCTL